VKIKRAEKNIKLLFGEVKKVLEKPDDDVIFIGSTKKVETAKAADIKGGLISCIYSAYGEVAKDFYANPNGVSKT